MSELSINGEKSFFEFFINNKEAVLGIVDAQIGRFVQSFDRDEIKQDVLLALERCAVLENYNPDKASFNTYFTRVVRGYISHWFDKQENPSWRPYPNEAKEGRSKHRYERTYYRSFNGMVNDADGTIPIDIAVMPSIEEELSLKQSIAVLRSNLNESLFNVFDLVASGNTVKEISTTLGNIEEANVRVKINKIKSIGKKLPQWSTLT